MEKDEPAASRRYQIVQVLNSLIRGVPSSHAARVLVPLSNAWCVDSYALESPRDRLEE